MLVQDMMKLLRLLLLCEVICLVSKERMDGYLVLLVGVVGGFTNHWGGFLFLVGFKLVVHFVGRVGEGFLPGVSVGDFL